MIITLFNKPRCTLLCGGVCHSFIETSVVTFSTADLREDSPHKAKLAAVLYGFSK